jgi:glutamate---cysteine ligase / carboxylate-amine ligase
MLNFKPSKPLTVGVELELQILNTRDYGLARGAEDLIHQLYKKPQFHERVKPEITESMIELNSSVHERFDPLLAELKELRDAVCQAADQLNLSISGGGAHPFSVWKDRRIYPTERFMAVSNLYGYLAKQFTVFGQHVHIGCPDGDAAIYLAHELAKYIPFFIALSAASPYSQSEDTSFETSRLHAVASFPLSGHMPKLANWQEFNVYFDEMKTYGIVESIKDFYWDIRPKPEFGTVEVRIFDTPLTVEMAAALASLVQTLCARLLDQKPTLPDVSTYRVYGYNRFQACRFGYDAELVDPHSKKAGQEGNNVGGKGQKGHFRLGDELMNTLNALMPKAAEIGTVKPLIYLQELVESRQNGASWMRAMHAQSGTLTDVMRMQSALFRSDNLRAT